MKFSGTLTCYCCGHSYERGHFKCCAPPTGMASHKWLEQFCRVQLAPGKYCNKCPRCGCEHRVKPKITGSEIGMSAPQDIRPINRGELRNLADRALREAGEERL